MSRFWKLEEMLDLCSTWPALVGKGGEANQEPPIPLDVILPLIAKAKGAGGNRFAGASVMLAGSHFDVKKCGSSEGLRNEAKRFAGEFANHGVQIGPIVPPTWQWEGGGEMTNPDDHDKIISQFRIGLDAREVFESEGVLIPGHDPVYRIDTCTFAGGKSHSQYEEKRRIVAPLIQKLSKMLDAKFGENARLVVEFEICWDLIDNIKDGMRLIREVGQDNTGVQCDGSHLLTELLGICQTTDADDGGYCASTANLPKGFDFRDNGTLEGAWQWAQEQIGDKVFDWHCTQNDGTVHGQGQHDKTGRHCRPDDPNGRIDPAFVEPLFLLGTKKEGVRVQSRTWDGCMMPNGVLEAQDYYDNVLTYMARGRTAMAQALSEA